MKPFNHNDLKTLQEGGYVFLPYKLVIESTIIVDKNGTTTIWHINRFKRWQHKIEKMIYSSLSNTFK